MRRLSFAAIDSLLQFFGENFWIVAFHRVRSAIYDNDRLAFANRIRQRPCFIERATFGMGEPLFAIGQRQRLLRNLTDSVHAVRLDAETPADRKSSGIADVSMNFCCAASRK